MVAGIIMLALAVLAVSNGELGIENASVRAVVLVDALVRVVFGAGFLTLSRYAARRSSGAALGTGVLGALGAAYLSATLAIRIPGISLQVTFPGNNAYNSANLEVALRSVRQWWHEPVEIGLAVGCLAALLAAVGALLPAFVSQLPARESQYRHRPVPQPDTVLIPAASRLPEPQEAASPTAADPWSSAPSLLSSAGSGGATGSPEDDGKSD